MVDAGAAGALWRAVRALPMFRRLLAIRMVSQFADGLFQAGLAGGLIFSTERATTAWAIAGSFAVLFLPYSLLGPFAGALLDRWDRRWVLMLAQVVLLICPLALGLREPGLRRLAVRFGEELHQFDHGVLARQQSQRERGRSEHRGLRARGTHDADHVGPR